MCCGSPSRPIAMNDVVVAPYPQVELTKRHTPQSSSCLAVTSPSSLDVEVVSQVFCTKTERMMCHTDVPSSRTGIVCCYLLLGSLESELELLSPPPTLTPTVLSEDVQGQPGARSTQHAQNADPGCRQQLTFRSNKHRGAAFFDVNRQYCFPFLFSMGRGGGILESWRRRAARRVRTTTHVAAAEVFGGPEARQG